MTPDTTAATDPASVTALKPSEVAEAVKLCIGARQSIIIRGEAGIGKSQVVEQVARELDMELIDTRWSQLSDVDSRGLPYNDGNGRMAWLIPSFFPRPDCKPTIWFHDEINRAQQGTQNALLQLINDRRLGEWPVPAQVAQVAAMNPEGSMAGVGTIRMSQALNSRFAHVNMRVDHDDWCKWAAGAAVNPVVLAFVRFRPDMLHVPHKTDYSFPCPRTWEFVSRIVTQRPAAAIELALIAGTVGYDAAIQFCAFLRTWRNLPNLDSILLDPQNARLPDASETGVQYAVSAGLAYRASEDNLGRVIQYLNRLPREFNTFGVLSAIRKTPDLQSTPEFTRWAIDNPDAL